MLAYLTYFAKCILYIMEENIEEFQEMLNTMKV